MSSRSLTGAWFPISSCRKSLCVAVPDVWMVLSPPGFRISALNTVREMGIVGERRGRGTLIPQKRKIYMEKRMVINRARLEITPSPPWASIIRSCKAVSKSVEFIARFYIYHVGNCEVCGQISQDWLP